MDLSGISAIAGIVGSLSGIIYLGIVLYDRRKASPNLRTDNTENSPTGSGASDSPSVALPSPPYSSQPYAKVEKEVVFPPVIHPPLMSPVTIDGATEFVKNQQAYQEWLKQHPQGFVINTHAKSDKRKEYTALHKAGCSSIRRYSDKITSGAYTERDFIKVCADDVPSLARWAARTERIGEPFSSVCGLCKPPVPAPDTAASTAVNAKPQTPSWTPAEFAALLESCRALPPAKGNYIVNDYAENVLLTVLDFQMQTATVEKAAQHYKSRVQFQIKSFDDLQNLLAKFPDDKTGNTQIAEYLWGYKLWTRVGLLRRLLNFLGEHAITTQEKLKEWAFQSDFQRDVAGKVKGIGFGIYKWLVMRQGVETVKPDIWVHRFLKHAIRRDMSDLDTVHIIEAAAKEMGLKAYELDWRIWESRIQ